MPDSGILINEGTDRILGHFTRTIGATDYEIQKSVIDEPFGATYSVSFTTATAFSVANDHIFELMSGADNRTLLRRIRLWQVAAATAAAVKQLQILRLTTAGTGGTAYTPRAVDAVDSVATATCMTLPSSKGAEGFVLADLECALWSTVPTTGLLVPILDERFDDIHSKSPASAAGTGNGIALKLMTADGGSPTVRGYIEFSELNYA